MDDWSEFASALPRELAAIKHYSLVAVRNFSLVTLDLNKNNEIVREIDREQLVRCTGTDRDANSTFWNAEGHDYDHDLSPAGKTPADIIYAYVAEMCGNGYLVHYKYPNGKPELIDLTESLSEQDAISIYDADKLERVSKNEHWFTGDPHDALLLVFRLWRS